MDEVERQFVEGMGLNAEEEGMPRVSGQIVGLLMLRERALSLDEIGAELRVSKASVSTNARSLARMGLIERASRAGDRRDFYRVDADAPDRSLGPVVDRITHARDLLQSTLAKLPAERRVQRARLATMRDWHAFLLKEIDLLVARWHRERGLGKGGARGWSESQKPAPGACPDESVDRAESEASESDDADPGA